MQLWRRGLRDEPWCDFGAPATVARGIAAFVEQTCADEIMITSNIHDHAERLQSSELVAEMMGSAPALE